MPDGQKIALVTGVSGGLGGKITQFLLDNGWTVWGLSRTRPALSHERLSWKAANLSQPDEVSAVLKHLPTGFDALILAGGMSGPVGPGLSLSLDGWRETFEVNFFAPLAIAQAFLSCARPNACVIFFSGGGAVTPRPLVGPYAISKLAVVKLAEQLALEYPRFRFYAIAPGAHDTNIFREQRDRTGESMPTFADFSAVKRLTETFLADANGQLNGRFVHVRDDIAKLLSVPEGGTIRRIELR